MKKPGFEGIGMTSKRTRQRLVDELRNKGICNENVLLSMLETPRHAFMDEAMAHRAYDDMPQPIGYGQTISQPYIVARMTEALLGDNQRLNKVLEIGTGSGYQAAVLSTLVDKVYSVERIKGLLDLAKARFSQLGIRNIYTKYDDGSVGWAEQAPFDGIIVTCAATSIPNEYLDQLAVGGRLVIPLESDSHVQQLQIVTKLEQGYNTTSLELVRFVPLLSGKE